MVRLAERMPRGANTYRYKRRSIGYRTIWAQKHEHVWELGGSDSHIRIKRARPLFLHVAVIGSDDRIMGNIGGIETSRADDDL